MQRYLIWTLQGCATLMKPTMRLQDRKSLICRQRDRQKNIYGLIVEVTTIRGKPPPRWVPFTQKRYTISYIAVLVHSEFLRRQSPTIVGVNRKSLTYRGRNPYQNARLFEYREAQQRLHRSVHSSFTRYFHRVCYSWEYSQTVPLEIIGLTR